MDKVRWDDIHEMLKRDPKIDSVEPNGDDVVMMFVEEVYDGDVVTHLITYEMLEFFVHPQIQFGLKMTGTFMTDEDLEVNSTVEIFTMDQLFSMKELFKDMSNVPGIWRLG